MTVEFVLSDTIAALASAPGPAPRGIVRVSGDAVRQVVEAVFTPEDRSRWDSARKPWRHPGHVRLDGVDTPLDVSVLLWPSSRSYTGEALAEFHTLGAPPLLDALLQALFAAGARAALRGEFTLRAFLAGRIDLLQAEAVIGVIEASDQQQLQVALAQLGGGLSGRIAEIHENLLLYLADLEAGLDFVDEDIEFVSRAELIHRLDESLEFFARLQRQSSGRMLTSPRLKVVLAGLPNAGKSTLFNALIGHEGAIVSEVAGTTRDYLTCHIDFDDLPIELIDTAGWENATEGLVRAAGDHRQQQWEHARLLVWCSGADQSRQTALQDQRLLSETRRLGPPVLHVVTKGDVGQATHENVDVVVSARTGAGLAELHESLRSRLQSDSAGDELLGSTAARCHDSLQLASGALLAARQAAENREGDELIAMELHAAVDALGSIVGRTWTDDILDRIFSRFCIGK